MNQRLAGVCEKTQAARRLRWGQTLSACLMVGSLAAPSHAAPPEDSPDNAITLEPLAVVFSRTITLEYERGFGPVGLALAGALGLGDIAHTSSQTSGDFIALGLTLSVRIYPWDLAPRGAYIGPYSTLMWVEAEAGGHSESGVGWSVGALVGYTWLLGTSFVVSGGVGLGWYEHEVGEGESGLVPALRLALGAAF